MEQNEDATFCHIDGHTSANNPMLSVDFSLPAPTGVSATDGTLCNKVRITWNAVPNADAYDIIRGNHLTAVSTLFYEDIVTSTTPQEYKVYAIKISAGGGRSTKYGSDTGFSIDKPSQPGSISGSSEPCKGSAITYSISPVSGATSYTWTLPSGWSGTSTTTSITATAGASGGNISVTANNSCGSSVPRTTGILVDVPIDQLSAMIGPTSVCQGSSYTYNISSVIAGSTTVYFLTYPSGWQYVSGGVSGNKASYVLTAGSSSGTISLKAQNSCGSVTSALDVTANTTAPAQPNLIIPLGICFNYSALPHQFTFSIAPVSGATSYTWTLPSGWSGSSASTSITIDFGANPNPSSGTLSVTANNSCGLSTPATDYIEYVYTSPPTPGVITGSTSVCEGYSQTYSIEPVDYATSYTWTLPSGWSGSSTSNSIEAIAGASGGPIKVFAKNNFCGSSLRILDIAMASKPTVTTSSIGTASSSTATGGGNITSNGGAEVTVSGVCWGTSPDPTTSGSKTTDGTTTGSFTSTINGLTENVTYYIRAYATNCSGTGYGSNVQYNSSNAIEVIQSDEASVYPNPVSGNLNIEFKNGTYKTINIINPQGVILKTEKAISPLQQLDFSQYEPGLYILEFVKTGGETERIRVVKH